MSISHTSPSAGRSPAPTGPPREPRAYGSLMLRYDGDEVPVLIRLPDLTLNATAATAAEAAPVASPKPSGATPPDAAPSGGRKNRRRKRSGRNRGGQNASEKPAAEKEQEVAKKPAAPNASGSLIDRSRLLIALVLFVVTGLTYVALQGRGGKSGTGDDANWDKPVQAPAVAQPAAPPAEIGEHQVTLWPAETSPTDAAIAAPQADTQQQPDLWPPLNGGSNQQLAADASTTHHAVDYAQPAAGGAPCTCPTPECSQHGQSWPDEAAEPNAAPVQGWPDAPVSDSAGGGYSTAPLRTGMRNDALDAGNQTSSGTHLNGTTESPRPRVNYERDRSLLY